MSGSYYRNNPLPYSGLGLCLWVCLLLSSASQAQSATPTNEIQSVAAVRQLTAEQAAQHLPVRLQGTLSFFDAGLFAYFFQDDTAGIYLFYDPARQPALATGEK